MIALFLTRTRFGRFIYATGDNPLAARTSGLPTRPVIVAQYVISALIAFLAGILMTGLVSGINTRLYNSTLIYDVLLVVVLGESVFPAARAAFAMCWSARCSLAF